MCSRCELLETQVDNLRGELTKIKDAWAVDMANNDTDIRVLKRKVTTLRNELDGKRKEDPQAKEIAELLRYAKEQWAKNKRWAIDPGGDRWNLTLKQLKRPAYNFDVLRACIDGLTREPFVGPRGRSHEHYPGSEKLVDIVYAYGTDERIRAWLDKAERLLNPRPEVQPVPVVQELRRIRTRPDPWREPIQIVLEALRTHGYDPRPAAADSWRSRCPVHQGDNPSSLVTSISDDGTVLMKCWAHDCEFVAICDAIGVRPSDTFAISRRAA